MPKITVHGGVTGRREAEPRPAAQGSLVLVGESAPELVRLPQNEVGPGDGPQDGDEYEDREYESWPYQALRTEAKERGLSAGGTASQLAARLAEDDARGRED